MSQTAQAALLAKRWSEFSEDAISLMSSPQATTGMDTEVYPSWSVHDLLAHLASTQSAVPKLVEAALSKSAGSGDDRPFDADRWNASQVRRRQEVSVQDLRLELVAASRELNRLLLGLSDDDLDLPVPIGAGRGNELGQVLSEMADHQSNHLADVARRLKRP